MEKLSARRAALWMGLLTLLFCLGTLVFRLAFWPREGTRAVAARAETDALLTGRDDNMVALELLPGETVDLNTATEEELKKLPGIGDGLAAAILEYRETKGPFTRIEQLKEVPGIGEKRFDAVKDLISVG